MKKRSFKLFCVLLSLLMVVGCGVLKPSNVDTRKVPVSGKERALQNLEQGKGLKLSNLGKSGKTNYEFSTSNPMWRATLETLDFIPMTTVDYAGGIVITDWYAAEGDNEEIKISVRFLSNEVAAENIKIIVHKKSCTSVNNCAITQLKSQIGDELSASIIRKAALYLREAENKN